MALQTLQTTPPTNYASYKPLPLSEFVSGEGNKAAAEHASSKTHPLHTLLRWLMKTMDYSGSQIHLTEAYCNLKHYFLSNF